jgi:hypothetical protein
MLVPLQARAVIRQPSLRKRSPPVARRVAIARVPLSLGKRCNTATVLRKHLRPWQHFNLVRQRITEPEQGRLAPLLLLVHQISQVDRLLDPARHGTLVQAEMSFDRALGDAFGLYRSVLEGLGVDPFAGLPGHDTARQ